MGWWPFKRREPKRETCRRYGFCEAWAWPACADGCCKYHCDNYCKCAPIGDGRPLRVVDGGKGK